MATRKKIGQVTPEEKNEIQQLFERRNGLNELAKILTADNAELYEIRVKSIWLHKAYGEFIINDRYIGITAYCSFGVASLWW